MLNEQIKNGCSKYMFIYMMTAEEQTKSKMVDCHQKQQKNLTNANRCADASMDANYK